MKELELKPQRFNVLTNADEIGALTKFERIPGESLKKYKDRLLEDNRLPANSTYDGLINAINRDLGLERKKALEVRLKSKLVFPNNNDDIVISGDTIIDNRIYSYITSPSIKINNNTISFDDNIFIENELIGLTLFLGNDEYLILSNNTKQIIFDGIVSNIGDGISFNIQPKWIQDAYVGLNVDLDENSFVIIENTENRIRVDSEYLEKNFKRTMRVIANRPRIHITSSRIILYKDFIHESNFQIDKIIDIKLNGLTHRDILNEINQSDFFECIDLLPHNVDVYAKTFKQQDSDVMIYQEPIPISKYFKLQYGKIKEGSLKFSQENIFFKEVRNLENVPYGPYYYVNHKAGIIHGKKIPTETGGTVSYIYMDFPYRIESSPAIITAFSDKNAETFLFNQTEKRTYTDVRDKYMSIQPKSDMVEYVAKLLSKSKDLWGE